MKKIFIDELMRRQDVSGTFELTSGTVVPLDVYKTDDPVAKSFRNERDTPLGGEPWDPQADCEYLRKAMKGIGECVFSSPIPREGGASEWSL